MWEWARNHSADQVWVNSSTWYPIITQESPSLKPTTGSELTMFSDGTKPRTEDPSPPCREGWGIEWLSAKPQSYMPHHIGGMAGGNGLSSRRLPLLKAVEGAATLCISGVGWWPSSVAHIPAMGKLQRVAMVQTPMVEPP